VENSRERKKEKAGRRILDSWVEDMAVIFFWVNDYEETNKNRIQKDNPYGFQHLQMLQALTKELKIILEKIEVYSSKGIITQIKKTRI
jgi:hypothetical protein